MTDSSKVSEGQRRQMIAEAAYFRAERRGFDGGDPVADWIEAEVEVDERLRRLEDERVLERLEEGIAAATKKVAALKRKAAALASGARSELLEDVDKLAHLRDSLRSRVKELKTHGGHAGREARKQAERLWDETREVLQRLTSRPSA